MFLVYGSPRKAVLKPETNLSHMVNLYIVLLLLPSTQLGCRKPCKVHTFHFTIFLSISTLKQKKINFIIVRTDLSEQYLLRVLRKNSKERKIY